MLKNLKRKFILTNMLLVGIALLVVFVSICTNIYSSQLREINRSLHAPLGAPISKDGEFGYMTSVIVVAGIDGEIYETYVRGASLDRDNLSYAVNQAVEDEANKGRVKKLSLFFEKRLISEDKYVIAFVDSSRFDETMLHSILVLFILYTLAMIVVYFISCFTASIAIKPVQKSWDQQKRFVADASHELKTPLTVILANNEILKSKKNAIIKDEQQWIDSTIDEARHMKKLVEDMLFLAKNDSADIKQQRTEVDLSELVLGDVLQFDPVAYEIGVDLDCKIDENISFIADGTQMKQLMHILIDNGIKYAISEEGNPEVLVELKRGSKIEITVKNTCKMLSQNQIDHIFDRFYRGDDARTRIYSYEGSESDIGGGYGLGLAIAKAIVENHNGKILVKSDIDAGPNGKEGIEFKVIF